MAASARQGSWSNPPAEAKEFQKSSPAAQPAPRDRELRPAGLGELAAAYAKLGCALLRVSQRSFTARCRQAATRTAREADQVARRARARYDFARREQPVQSLAVLACMGVLGGIALRIWRTWS